MSGLKGKTALITGAASGIGLNFAEALLENDLKAIAVADIDEIKARNAVKDLTEKFGENRVFFVKVDISNKIEFKECFDKVVQTFKTLDIVINNAGVLDEINWEKQIAVNINGTITGTLLAIEEYLPKFKSSDEGILVNIASVGALDVISGTPIYVATKHTVLGITRAFSTNYHYKKFKVRVLTVCPGGVGTDLTENIISRIQYLDPENIENFPIQNVQNLGKSLIIILEKGKHGSVWIIEDNKPPYEVFLRSKQNLSHL